MNQLLSYIPTLYSLCNNLMRTDTGCHLVQIICVPHFRWRTPVEKLRCVVQTRNFMVHQKKGLYLKHKIMILLISPLLHVIVCGSSHKYKINLPFIYYPENIRGGGKFTLLIDSENFRGKYPFLSRLTRTTHTDLVYYSCFKSHCT